MSMAQRGLTGGRYGRRRATGAGRPIGGTRELASGTASGVAPARQSAAAVGAANGAGSRAARRVDVGADQREPGYGRRCRRGAAVRQ